MIDLIIINKLGLHARAAANLVNTASRYTSDVILHKGNQSACAKSIMGLMMLGASCGTPIQLTAEGEDADEALKAVKSLIDNRFGEDE